LPGSGNDRHHADELAHFPSGAKNARSDSSGQIIFASPYLKPFRSEPSKYAQVNPFVAGMQAIAKMGAALLLYLTGSSPRVGSTRTQRAFVVPLSEETTHEQQHVTE
jgi:hypothetical protein